MAERMIKKGIYSKDTVRLHSSDADEIFCQPCSLSGTSKVASGYCSNCREYFCRQCIILHKNQRISKQHEILDQDKMPALNVEDTSYTDCGVMCDRHPTVSVKFYCTKHKVDVCSECVVLQHAECNHNECVRDIQDLTEPFIRSEVDFIKLYQTIDTLHTELSEVDISIDTESEAADKSNTSLVNSIRTLKVNMSKTLDEMEIELLKEAANIKSDGDKSLKMMKDNTAAFRETVEKTKHHLDANVHEIKTLFVLALQSGRKLADMEIDLTQIKERQHLSRYKLLPSDLMNILARSKTFGTIIEADTDDFSAGFKCDIHVKTSKDTADCRPAGIAVLQPSRVMIGDENNKKLKLVNISNSTVVSTCDVASSPKDIAVLNSTQIAVTFPKERKIRFYHVDDEIILAKEHRVPGKCLGIAHKESKLAVSYDNCGRIDILNAHTCTEVHKILPKQKTEDFYKCPRYIIFGLEKDTLIVSDNDTSVVSIVTFQGEILTSLCTETLRTPRGLAVRGDGTVIVTSCANDKIHVISRDFSTSRILIQDDNNVRYPECICLDNTSNILFVWCSTLDQPMIDNAIRAYTLS